MSRPLPLVFPQTVRGKPLLAVTNKELEQAVADFEEAYVFLSGMDRDMDVSDRLQGIRAQRKEYRINIRRSRLIIDHYIWRFPGPERRARTDPKIGWNGLGYLCVLANNHVIPTGGGKLIRWGPAIRFKMPATGYLVEVESGSDYETTNEVIMMQSFDSQAEFTCTLRGVPHSDFNDLG